MVGVPHDEWGEEVGAAVVLKEGEELRPRRSAPTSRTASPPTSTRARLVVDALPKGPTGKILKREIETPAKLR